MKFFISSLLFFSSLFVSAQDSLSIASDSGFVHLHADARLALLVNKQAGITTNRFPNKTRGYRIQIYYGSDRNKATQSKIDFLRTTSGLRVYTSYKAPNFRIRVGDFVTKKDAQNFFNMINGIYENAMIVPDIINAPRQKNNDD